MMTMTRSARALSLMTVVMLAACASNPVEPMDRPPGVVNPRENTCDVFAASPAVVLTQGVLTAGTIVRTEARWCELGAPVLQTFEFNPGSFVGGVNAAVLFTQAYAKDQTVPLPAGVTKVGGPRSL
jgi:hypothetical protein